MGCQSGGKYRWFYTGNQVGDLNHTGDYNFVAGGPPGSGISAGTLAKLFFPDPANRAQWDSDDAKMDQQTLDAAFPFIDLTFIIDIILSDVTFRVSNRNVYVKDSSGSPRFYEARVVKAPTLSVTQGEWLSPGFQIGDLSFNLNNRDGYFNPWLPHGLKYESWIGAQCNVYVGFSENLENYFNIFTGFVTPKKGVESTDQELKIKCYDKFQDDEVSIPPLVYDINTFPELDTNFDGQYIPLIYGDWTEDVEYYGQIPAAISNALAENPSTYELKISQNALQSIGDVFLHRGDRSAENPDGPIKFDPNAIIKDPDNGRVIVPSIGPVLTEVYELIKKSKAGAASGLNTLVTDDPTVDFVASGVKAGDTVTKGLTGETATVQSVAVAELSLIGGITFALDDDYGITTLQYGYLDSDKISCTCVGKKLSILSTNRLSDAGLLNATPTALSDALDGTFWFADNSKQQIYQVDYHNTVKRTIPYATIDPSLTVLTGIAYQPDNTLWILDDLSVIRRFLLSSNELGLSFSTGDVAGLDLILSQPRGLTMDENNHATLIDNDMGEIYVIDPFTPLTPTLLYSFNRSVFAPTATDITDLSVDVNALNLVVVDRVTHTVYRVDRTDGTLISSFDYYAQIGDQLTYVSGISTSQDGTLFILDQATKSLTNYNEAEDASTNPGWIARDIIQQNAGKVSTDFDLVWNETCRKDLSKFKTRLYISDQTTAVKFCNKLLQQFNTSLYLRYQKYALFFISFENFRTNGAIIREGDIQMNSFNPSKEYNQYFNSLSATIDKRPFKGDSLTSDNYSSASGVQTAGLQIPKVLDMQNVYRREDLDILLPLFVRLSVAEPEFVTMTLGFRFLFAQMNDFFNINFFDQYLCDEGYAKGGRRFNNIPSFIRQLNIDLGPMTLTAKVWSLGTTAFGQYVPVGQLPGGQFDPIILTNLGTPAYVSATGIIASVDGDSPTLEQADSTSAENRTAPICGNAWAIGMAVDIVDASSQLVVFSTVIQDLQGDTFTFKDVLPIVLTPTVKNAAGFSVSGHYLRLASFEKSFDSVTKYFGFFTKPLEGYPLSATSETEEQRAGLHNFDNGRIPYILHPVGFVPN